MTPDQITSAMAYWPVCVQCAGWLTGGVMLVVVVLLGITGTALIVGGKLRR